MSEEHEPSRDRAAICDVARKTITKDRNNVYGEPEDSFGHIAENWTWWLKMRGIATGKITAFDVAQMMVGFKQARSANQPDHFDSAVDQVGYSAIAGELSGKVEK